ncbi:MAG: hypothetical protein WAQ25_02315 [Candidatus Saccharimonas sp.]
MGRYIEQTESRSELQQKIAAELRAKAAARAKQEGEATGDYRQAPDGVEDAAYLKGTKTTTTLAPVWVMLFFAAIAVFAYFIYQVNR